MKRQKCPNCKRPMFFDSRRKQRRAFGPFGWYYMESWWCACGRRCNSIRVTKKEYEVIKQAECEE